MIKSNVHQLSDRSSSVGSLESIYRLEQINRKKIVRLVIWVFLSAAVFVAATIFWLDLNHTWRAPVTLAFTAMHLIGLGILEFTSRTDIAARIAMYVQFLFLATVITQTGGITSPTLAFTPLIAALAVVLLSRWESLLMMIAFIGGITGLSLATSLGLQVTDLISDNYLNIYYATTLIYAFFVSAMIYDFNSKLNRELSKVVLQLAQRDYLTGVLNRRALSSMLDTELRRALRESSPLSILIIDLDFFKLYNDQHGHVQGDKCLKQVASCIEEMVRNPPDIVGRYGGEEFLVILPGADSERGREVAERIRGGIKSLDIRFGLNDSQIVTATIGVATSSGAESNPEQLVKLADGFLYRGKAEGKDRVVSAESGPPRPVTPRLSSI
ncbi:MAG: GGDEF domain-containing protein [bacterium]